MKHLPLLLMFSILTVICIVPENYAMASEGEIYKVGVSDVLQITVLEHEDLFTMATVSSDGTITFPYLGSVYVKDMSLSQIGEDIKKKLADGYVKYPVVTVSLVKSLSSKIFTYGELNRIGEMLFFENMTVGVAMSIAGGVSRDGLYGKIKVQRRKQDTSVYKEIMEGTLDNGFIEDKKLEDMLLQPDDILTVEPNKTFFIHGEVVKVGQFALEKDMTVVRALSVAGGIRDDGLYGRIKIRRKGEGNTGYRDIADANLNNGTIDDKKIEDLLLQQDDILIVERVKMFFIHGEVVKVGQFALEKDMTVVRALSVAGGIRDDGLYGKIKIRRKGEGNTGYTDIADANLNDGAIDDKTIEDLLLEPDDILMVERNKTFFVHGEVVKVGQFALEKDMTVVRALSVTGGIRENGLYGKIKIRRTDEGITGYEDLAEANLNNGVIEDDSVGDMLLYPDDIIVVERNMSFFIYGEVNRAGEYTLKNNLTVFNAISLAGGFNKWGSPDRVEVLRPINNGNEVEKIKVHISDVIKGDASKDILLKSGDTIVVSAGIL